MWLDFQEPASQTGTYSFHFSVAYASDGQWTGCGWLVGKSFESETSIVLVWVVLTQPRDWFLRCDYPAVLELTDQSVKILWEVELWQWVGLLGLSVTHNSFLQQPGHMICLCTQTDYRHTFTKIGSITEGVEIDRHNFDDNTSMCHKS